MFSIGLLDITVQHISMSIKSIQMMSSISIEKCIATCCSVLQCVAVCCGVLQCVAVRCSVL